jgi:N-alpha-acetyltransferase 30
MAEETSKAEENKEEKAELPSELRYLQYEHALEKQFLPRIRALISKDLSEPYSIYVYRYFLYQWGDLCFMVCANCPLFFKPFSN